METDAIQRLVNQVTHQICHARAIFLIGIQPFRDIVVTDSVCGFLEGGQGDAVTLFNIWKCMSCHIRAKSGVERVCNGQPGTGVLGLEKPFLIPAVGDKVDRCVGIRVARSNFSRGL